MTMAANTGVFTKTVRTKCEAFFPIIWLLSNRNLIASFGNRSNFPVKRESKQWAAHRIFRTKRPQCPGDVAYRGTTPQSSSRNAPWLPTTPRSRKQTEAREVLARKTGRDIPTKADRTDAVMHIVGAATGDRSRSG